MITENIKLNSKNNLKLFVKHIPLHVMMLPSVIIAGIFMIVPMLGIIMAFQVYEPSLGILKSQFVDIYQFRVLFTRPDFVQVLVNTVLIAIGKIVLMTILSILFALLINEVKNKMFKKTIQTIIFLPYFLSWALIGSIFVEMFSLQGSFNHVLSAFGIEPVYWIADNRYFRIIIILTDVWKNTGYQVVVFLAAITAIDGTLYEAADVDGANRWQKCIHVTLPGISTMIVLMCVLNIGNIMNAGFEQILVMYNPSVYETGDILDTMAYRIGLLTQQYSQGTAIGLFKSAISCFFFAVSYKLAYKINGYHIF